MESNYMVRPGENENIFFGEGTVTKGGQFGEPTGDAQGILLALPQGLHVGLETEGCTRVVARVATGQAICLVFYISPVQTQS